MPAEDASDARRHGQHGGNTPLHLCPWCKAHVDEHDGESLARHGRKWRLKLTHKG